MTMHVVSVPQDVRSQQLYGYPRLGFLGFWGLEPTGHVRS